MSAIAGLMAGAQYFQAPDKPLYVDHIPSLLLWPSLTVLKLLQGSAHHDHHGGCRNSKCGGAGPRVYLP